MALCSKYFLSEQFIFYWFEGCIHLYTVVGFFFNYLSNISKGLYINTLGGLLQFTKENLILCNCTGHLAAKIFIFFLMPKSLKDPMCNISRGPTGMKWMKIYKCMFSIR